MKKILHFNLYKTVPIGVLNQVVDEVRAVDKLKDLVDWDVKVYSHDKPTFSFQECVVSTCRNAYIKHVLNYFILRNKAYSWLAHTAPEYDAILLRHRTGDVFEYFYSNRIDNYFTVHHSMEIPEARTRKLPFSAAEAILEKYVGPNSPFFL